MLYAFLTCSWRFLISNKLEQTRIQNREIFLGYRNMQEKLENQKSKFPKILLGDKNATSLCSKNISTLPPTNDGIKFSNQEYTRVGYII